jgi:hypothetical protein
VGRLSANAHRAQVPRRSRAARERRGS